MEVRLCCQKPANPDGVCPRLINCVSLYTGSSPHVSNWGESWLCGSILYVMALTSDIVQRMMRLNTQGIPCVRLQRTHWCGWCCVLSHLEEPASDVRIIVLTPLINISFVSWTAHYWQRAHLSDQATAPHCYCSNPVQDTQCSCCICTVSLPYPVRDAVSRQIYNMTCCFPQALYNIVRFF